MRVVTASLLLASTLALPLTSHCEDSPRWGSSATANSSPREPLENTAFYYEPGKVKKQAGTVSLMAYNNPSATEGDDGTEYLFNCSTHEYTSRPGGKGNWAAPIHLVSGEMLYPIAHKLCDWGPGFFKKLIE